jgi:hypothetical protein
LYSFESSHSASILWLVNFINTIENFNIPSEWETLWKQTKPLAIRDVGDLIGLRIQLGDSELERNMPQPVKTMKQGACPADLFQRPCVHIDTPDRCALCGRENLEDRNVSLVKTEESEDIASAWNKMRLGMDLSACR